MTTIETRDGQPVVFEHAVEMAEYLCALDFGLDLIAKRSEPRPSLLPTCSAPASCIGKQTIGSNKALPKQATSIPSSAAISLPTFRPCNAIACLPDRKSGGTN